MPIAQLSQGVQSALIQRNYLVPAIDNVTKEITQLSMQTPNQDGGGFVALLSPAGNPNGSDTLTRQQTQAQKEAKQKRLNYLTVLLEKLKFMLQWFSTIQKDREQQLAKDIDSTLKFGNG